MASCSNESKFAALEKKSLNKQHKFIAQYKDEFEFKEVSNVIDVEAGDHLRWRGKGMSYDHHVVCTKVEGEDITFAEYTGPFLGTTPVSQSTSSSDSGRVGVIKETTWPLSKLIEKNAEIVVWPERLKIFSPEEIVKRAKTRYGENYYSVTSNNCEHFATWCICGLQVSLQVKSWHVILKELVFSVLETAPMVIANAADEVLPFLKDYKKYILWFDAALEAGIAVKELYKIYQQYKDGKYESGWDIVKEVIWVIAEGLIGFFLAYIGLYQADKALAGAFIEARKALYDLKKAWDQWNDGVLISTPWQFIVKVIEILAKGFLRFFLGYLGSKYSAEIFENYLNPLYSEISKNHLVQKSIGFGTMVFGMFGGYLASFCRATGLSYLAGTGIAVGTKIFEMTALSTGLSSLLANNELCQRLFCGGVGGCLGHLFGAVIKWIVENWEDIVNSG